MATFLFFLLLFSAVEAQQRQWNISLGSSLTPTTNSSWPSPSGLYAFGFFPQNINDYAVGIFIAGIPNKTVVWTANWDNPTVPRDAVFQLTRDGRLVWQKRGSQNIIDVVNPGEPIQQASMLDNGNFVLYGSGSRIIWQSFDHPTDTFLPGQRLASGGLFSSASGTNHAKGIFVMQMQRDGNLVQYPANDVSPKNAYFSSETFGGNVSLNLEKDGRLYLWNGTSFLWNLTRGGYPVEEMTFLMRLDVGGIFHLYTRSVNPPGDWNVTWSSTNDKCRPRGFCGVNAFCVLMDDEPNCKCLPGFDFVQTGNWTAGCERNFTQGSCQGKDAGANYEIRAVENSVWEDNSYNNLDELTKQDCGEACLDDCNCEAAFYKDGSCRKQRLPLRYGRRSSSASDVTLVRVSTSKPDSGNSGKEVTKKEAHLNILIFGICLMVVGVLAVSISVIYVHRKRKDYKKITNHGEANVVQDVALHAFTFSELSEATDDFKEELGRGASGSVYKGVLQNRQQVAVKRLEKEFAEGEREFQTEMKIIGRTHHRNLVRLLGYCLEGPNKLLVLEYMSNGSLADILFKPENRPTWDERMKLARDIARGILYLHEECNTQIIHCDIKPQNILMDENLRAKISDFGLAKLLKQDQTNTYTGIRGTKGYVAPEWHNRQPVTVKADVFSFGIVLLEIICCRKSVDWSLSEEEAILEDWVYNCYACGELERLVGSESGAKRKDVERVVKIGIWCIQYEPSLRPTMKKVLLMLEGTVDIPIPPSPTSFLSSV